jgi:carbamoyltransferase
VVSAGIFHLCLEKSYKAGSCISSISARRFFMKVEDIWKKSVEHFPVQKLTCDDLLPVYDKFKEIGYTEESILDRFNTGYIGYMKRHDIPKYLATTMKENNNLDRLIKLFILNMSLSASEAEETFGNDIMNIMFNAGLLNREESGDIISPVGVFPCRGCFIATDRFYGEICTPKHVYPLMSDSYNLAKSLIDEPVEKTLDLCTGSGVQAIVASRFSKKVIGVDINPRAINFARFNALLNQAENVEFRKGNLYEAVKGEKFDRILSNPPFVPSPEKRLYYRDGGQSGEEIFIKIIAGLKNHLNEGGMCQFITLLVFTGGDYNQKVASWIPEKKFHIFSIHSPHFEVEDYIIQQVGGIAHQSFEKYCEYIKVWLDSYREAGIERVAEGLVNLRHTQSEPESEIKTMKYIIGNGCEKHIKAWFKIVEEQKSGDLADILMDNTISISPDIEYLAEKKRPDGETEYEVTFLKRSPYNKAPLSKDEKILVDLLFDKPLKGSELMNALSEKAEKLSDDQLHERFVSLVTRLIKDGILER